MAFQISCLSACLFSLMPILGGAYLLVNVDLFKENTVHISNQMYTTKMMSKGCKASKL